MAKTKGKKKYRKIKASIKPEPVTAAYISEQKAQRSYATKSEQDKILYTDQVVTAETEKQIRYLREEIDREVSESPVRTVLKAVSKKLSQKSAATTIKNGS